MTPANPQEQLDQDFDALDLMATALRECCELQLSVELRSMLAGQARQLGLHQVARLSAARAESPGRSPRAA